MLPLRININIERLKKYWKTKNYQTHEKNQKHQNIKNM